MSNTKLTPNELDKRLAVSVMKWHVVRGEYREWNGSTEVLLGRHPYTDEWAPTTDLNHTKMVWDSLTEEQELKAGQKLWHLAESHQLGLIRAMRNPAMQCQAIYAVVSCFFCNDTGIMEGGRMCCHCTGAKQPTSPPPLSTVELTARIADLEAEIARKNEGITTMGVSLRQREANTQALQAQVVKLTEALGELKKLPGHVTIAGSGADRMIQQALKGEE